MRTLTIGQLAGEAGVNVQTIRYYERRGLLDEPPRRPSGYREYPESDLSRLGFIRRAQGLGFTLNEIKDLLSLRMSRSTTPQQVRERVKSKIADVAEKVAELERIQGALHQMSAACEVHGPLGDCPFLDALEAQADAAA